MAGNKCMKKKLIIIALIILLASVGFVAADEAGIISINLQNSNSKIITNISNSTLQAQTNFTNSQATENITLTNSTLTLNVNGQNITISGDENGNVAVNTQGQSTASTPAPATIVPLHITSPPSWIMVDQMGIFNDYNVSETPDMYTVRIAITDQAYFQKFNELYSKNMTLIFPTEFYTDFGLRQIVYPYSNSTDWTFNLPNTPYAVFEIAFSSNPNHLPNSYLPDPPTDSSGEQYLKEAIGYYFSQYLENQTQ